MDRKTMMHFYKARRVTLGIAGIEKKRLEDNNKIRLERKDRRTQMFNAGRNISAEDEINTNASDNLSKENNVNSSNEKDKLLDRKIALQKYKREKEQIKQSLKQKKRPPFVVGIPHHGNSPVLKEMDTQKNRNGSKQIGSVTQTGKQRITRANSKLVQGGEVFVPKSPVQMFPFNQRKSVFSFQLNKGSGFKKLTSPHTPTVLKRSAQKSVQAVKEKVTSNLKRDQRTHKPVVKLLKNVLPKKKKSSTSSSDSGQSLAAPLPNVDALDDISEHDCQEAEPVAQFDCIPSSPPLVYETGVLEDNSLKSEISDELKTENPEESISQENQESPRREPRILVEKERSDIDNEVTFQRERVDNECDRLLSLAEDWESTSLKEVLPQDVTDEIDSVIGQTRLLTRDKFNQFRGLIEEFQTQKDSKQITVDDLNGFWDMVYLQVESLNKKFSHLEVLKVNSWEEPKTVTPHKKRKRGPPKRKQKKPDSPVKEDNIYPDNDVVLTSSISRHENITRRSRSQKKILFKQELENIPVESRIAANTFEECIAYTPRRSVRLVGKTPTKSSPKCSACKIPKCESSDCSKQMEKENSSRRSNRVRKNMTSSVGQELENASKESSPFGIAQPDHSNETNKTKKGFQLRPSKLILNDSSIKTPISTARKPLGVQDENSQLNPDSCSVRKSKRLQSAKKVAFDSSFGDGSNIKLPATPYSRKGSIRESFLDSFSE